MEKPLARVARHLGERGWRAALGRSGRRAGPLLGGSLERGGLQGRQPRLAASASKFFEKNEPELYAVFTGFPKIDRKEVEHRFYWIKQRVQERPTLILSHRMLFTKPSHVVMAERQYYIGHSYNSVQIANAALPVEKGLVLFYTSRTSIDQLAGFTGRVARPIAGDRLIERVTKRFETLRASGSR